MGINIREAINDSGNSIQEKDQKAISKMDENTLSATQVRMKELLKFDNSSKGVAPDLDYEVSVDPDLEYEVPENPDISTEHDAVVGKTIVDGVEFK